MKKVLYLFILLFVASFTACGNRQTTANYEAVTEAADAVVSHCYSQVSVCEPEVIVCNQTDAGVVINGTRWATRNVDEPGTFATNPEDAGMLFQWNRQTGWSATGEITDWDSSVPTGTTWYAENDPCPPGWRMPTGDELSALRNSGDFGWLSNDWVTRNGVNGRVFGNVPHQIFFPAVGYRSGHSGSLSRANTSGYYWSSTRADAQNAADMWFGSGRIDNSLSPMTAGFSVRCVAK